jgi:hypothetical protein
VTYAEAEYISRLLLIAIASDSMDNHYISMSTRFGIRRRCRRHPEWHLGHNIALVGLGVITSATGMTEPRSHRES